MKYSALKGTKDILPQDSYRWQHVEAVIRKTCANYGYSEIRTPVMEYTELFLRTVGDTTDIVQKEMYTFEDRGGRSVTLKPEGTAGAVRAFIEHGLFNNPLPVKLYYLYSPVFRYERPQAGRLREHHQFGVEVFGSPEAHTDAEVIALALSVLNKIGIKSLVLKINSIGCPECRPVYIQKLKEYFAGYLSEMCPDCKTRYENNPLRLIDCKQEKCKEIAKDAPRMIDSLCPECKQHFDNLTRCLEAAGIKYEIDTSIVRGLDYYTKTVFEIVSEKQNLTVCGGGRYDKLIDLCGGPDLPGVGFGMGLERLISVIEDEGIDIQKPSECDAYVICMNDPIRSFSICETLRKLGIKASFDHMSRSIKNQMRQAEKCGASFVVIEGDDEKAKGIIAVKDMKEGSQIQMPFIDLQDFLIKNLKETGA